MYKNLVEFSKYLLNFNDKKRRNQQSNLNNLRIYYFEDLINLDENKLSDLEENCFANVFSLHTGIKIFYVEA